MSFASTDRSARPRYQPLVIVLAAVCAGTLIDHQSWPWMPRSFELWLLSAAVALGAWFAFWRNNRGLFATVALLIALVAVGGGWHHARWSLFGEDELGRFATETLQPVCIEAVAVAAPQEEPKPTYDPLRSLPANERSRLTVDTVALRDGATWRSASGRAEVLINGRLDKIRAGDHLRIFGELTAPPPAANPGEFDTALFDRTNRKLSLIRVKLPSCVQIIKPGSWWNPVRWFDATRHFGDGLLGKYLSPGQAAMASAVLLGQREQVDRDTNEAFMETGTVHMLVIAGLHVGIVAWIFFLLFSAGWLRRRGALWCVMGITGAYMLLTTAQPPVIRATLLVWIVCGGMLLGRARVGLNSLALAGLIVLVVNPAALFHTGVQLSFLSVAVLMAAGQRLMRHTEPDPLDQLIAATRPWPEKILRRFGHRLAEAFAVGAAMWVAITPLTMARFHLLAPSALVINVLLLPVLTVAMASGLGVLVFGAWLPPIAMAFAWLCNSSLSCLERTVKWVSEFPGARYWVAGPSDVWLMMFYVCLAAVVLLPRWLPTPRWRWALFGGWCGVGLIAAAPLAHNIPQLRCTFVAVGHGGGEVLELPDGRTILYDAGRLGSPVGGMRSIAEYLWSRGITHLDAVVVSHADTDHYNALPGLLERFSVGVVYVSPAMFQHASRALDVLRTSVEQSGTKLEYSYAGDRIAAGQNVAIDVLHPTRDGVIGSDNANCIVLDVQCAGKRILLTGDLEPPGLEMVLNEARCHYNVLLAPHHGSAHSDPKMMAAWCTPEYVVISGAIADGTTVRPVYEACGATVFNTSESGAVTVTIDAQHMTVDTFRQCTSR